MNAYIKMARACGMGRVNSSSEKRQLEKGISHAYWLEEQARSSPRCPLSIPGPFATHRGACRLDALDVTRFSRYDASRLVSARIIS